MAKATKWYVGVFPSARAKAVLKGASMPSARDAFNLAEAMFSEQAGTPNMGIRVKADGERRFLEFTSEQGKDLRFVVFPAESRKLDWSKVQNPEPTNHTN